MTTPELPVPELPDIKILEIRRPTNTDGTKNFRVLAFCSIIISDAFYVYDLKLIKSGDNIFVAMPSKKVTTKCTGCGNKNYLMANFCPNCGIKLAKSPVKQRPYQDIIHPASDTCRARIHTLIMNSYESLDKQ